MKRPAFDPLSVALLGVGLALISVFPLAAVTSSWSTAQQSFWVAVLFRVGLLLAASGFAAPQLRGLSHRAPPTVWVAGLVILLAIAIRPRLIPVVALIVAAAAAVHFGLRWIGRGTR